MKRKHYVLLGTFLISLLLPPLVIHGILVVLGILQVAETGLCPAGPMDIPPYPCSVWDYTIRMTVGFWALMGLLGIAIGWGIVNGLIWLAGWGAYRLYQRRQR